jgi:hypothetical protein
MFENMVIYVKMRLLLDIYVNMFNVWKYDHLCENVTFIGYLCEICSMCDNMAIWCLGSIFEVYAISEVLCLVSNGHYTKSSNSSVSDEDKARRAH